VVTEETPAKEIQTFEKWSAIKKLFTLNGFAEDEAEWAANNKLDIDDPAHAARVSRLLKNRKDNVKFVMKYGKIPWEEAVDAVAETSKRNNIDKGKDPLDLFSGTSP